jgi:TetR/AcrR family transcriptional regulator, regulator of cefoperazone and chloramphenicol sensitivity
MKIPRQDAARTRESLLRAASDIFAEKGFRDATIAEISERAGTNIAAVNYHFGDKETLYREAWRQSLHDSLKAYPIDGGVADGASPRERLRGHIGAQLRRITDENNREFLIGFKELSHPTGLLEEVMREELRPLRERTEGLVREILGKQSSDMQVRFCAVGIMSQCVLPAFLNGVAKGESDDDPWRIKDIDAYVEHVVAFSLAGMAAVRRS